MRNRNARWTTVLLLVLGLMATAPVGAKKKKKKRTDKYYLEGYRRAITPMSPAYEDQGVTLAISPLGGTFRIRAGQKRRIATLRSKGSGVFKLGWPTTLGPPIYFSPDFGGIGRYPTEIEIGVKEGTEPGRYEGMAAVEDEEGRIIRIPIVVHVVR